MIALLVITDGRPDYIGPTLASARDNLIGPITRRVIYDDSGSPENRERLQDLFPEFEILFHKGGRQGFGGAINTAWQYLTREYDEPYVFHLEDDFTFNRPVNLEAMMEVLVRCPHLVQMALRRQPWNHEERAAGGFVEMHPDAYETHSAPLETLGGGEATWLEHSLFFTTNPSLYRRELCAAGWPTSLGSEAGFSRIVLAKPGARCGFWGKHPRDGGKPWVTHIGEERAGTGY